MKKFSEIGAIILVLSIVVSAVLVIIISGTRASHVHYVCLEVNPRVEFLTNSKHKVESIKPLNDEAHTLLIDEEFVGLEIEEACDKFLDLCLRSGYLRIGGNNNAVKLSVLSGLNQGLEVTLTRTINKFFVKNNVLGVVIDGSQDLQQFKDARKAKVDVEKYDLIKAVLENNNTESFDELKKLSNKKLIEKIEENHKAYSFKYTPEELENKVALIDFYRTIYENHKNSITSESTRSFKEKLKEFKSSNTRTYKIDYEKRYNEWLLS